MKQEDKELLLKDLCTRLPYSVVVSVTDINDNSYKKDGILYKAVNIDDDCNGIQFLFGVDGVGCLCDITEVKPYLRPMFLMTEEEIKEYNEIVEATIAFYKCPKSKDISLMILSIDWLNSHYFDYRGLIEKGLALKAPERMYKF